MRRVLSLALIVTALAAPAAAQTRAAPEAGSGFAAKPEVTAERHMIVAAHPLAARAGRAMLRRGGSAADAAIAALLVLNVVEPQSSGIGGGAFALVHGPGGLTSWDARETAPLAADERLFLDEDGAPLPFRTAVGSGRSVGTPGLVRLMERLHARHGRLAWADLFKPAIGLARNGFEASPRLAASVAAFGERLSATPAARLFLPGGVPVAEGERILNPALANTLERIARGGAQVFYRGPIAEEIVRAVGADPRPGQLAIGDLAAYRVIERPALCADWRDWRVCSMGPPSSGATTVLQILRLMEEADPDARGARLWHLFGEASRLAYADRARWLGDPDMVAVPAEGLLDARYLAGRAALIDLSRAAKGRAEAGVPPGAASGGRAGAVAGRAGTTHLSVVDAQGLAISLTASIEGAFGSGRVAGGFLLNNQLTDFAFRARDETGALRANAPAAGKRPRSSMAPTIVYEGERPVLLVGSPGGSRIPEYVASAILRMGQMRLGPAEAAAAPHASHRNRGMLVLEDGRWPPGMTAALRAYGHKVGRAGTVSGLHIIGIGPRGLLTGGADPRREGVALGD